MNLFFQRSILLLALAAVWCSSSCRERDHDPDTPTLGVSMASFTAPYASAAVREFKKYAGEKGLHLLLLDAQHDIQREAFNIDTLVSRRVDALLVNVVDAKGSRAALKKAAAAGLPVLCFNSNVDSPKSLGIRAYTGPQYYDQGVMAARVAGRLKPAGKAVIITGTPGYSPTHDREKGFTDTLASESPGIQVLDIQTAHWMRENAQRLMSDFITRFGKEIDIVYSQDDNMTTGAVNALRTAGYTPASKPAVISIGAMADGLPLVQEGWIDSTILQSPREDCRLAVDTALAILEGRQTEPFKHYFMEARPVDRSNVQEVIDMRLWD